MKIAGIVVLYNPDENIIDNIKSYLDNIEVLYVVDNSTEKRIGIINTIKSLNKIIYIDNNGNKGIANALNVGANLAIRAGYEWLLTMDQDSTFISGDSVDRMYRAALIYNRVAIISPLHTNAVDNSLEDRSEFSIVCTTMTSGNLLNLKAFQEIGGFRDDYFIDYVDHEFCLRARLFGFIIVRCNLVILKHNLGDIKKHRLGLTTNHLPIRRYYITRNRLYTMHMYRHFDPSFFWGEMYAIFAEAIKIILYERQKFEKLLMIYRGYRDFKKGITGEYGSRNK
jgi:rhamnosyltransferase